MSLTATYCKASIAPIRAEANDSAEMVSQLLFGEVSDVLEKEEKWWKVRTFSDNYEGWVDPKQIQALSAKEVNRWLDGLSYEKSVTRKIKSSRGMQIIVKGSFVPFGDSREFIIGNDAYTFEDADAISHSNSPVEIALEYLNAPYLWGGKTPFGIDCSGLVQAVFRFLDFNLPRDAWQQNEYGIEVDFNDIKPGDVAFFSNDKGKAIHTGIITDDKKIIHASGYVRINEIDKNGIIHDTQGYPTHYLSSIKRMI